MAVRFGKIIHAVACPSRQTLGPMNINGIEYRFQVASDVQRDGLGLECYRTKNEKEELVLEVFRNDSELKYVYSQFEQDLPLELIEYVVSISRKKLGEFVP